jgi:hypothetical protein
MNIYLSHPDHGCKVATMELEAEYDEKNGWTRYNPDTPSEPEAAPVNVLEVKRKYTRKAANRRNLSMATYTAGEQINEHCAC